MSIAVACFRIPEQNVYLINIESENRTGNMQITGYRDLSNTLCQLQNEELLKERSGSNRQLAKETFKENADFSQQRNMVIRKILKWANFADDGIDEKESLDQWGPIRFCSRHRSFNEIPDPIERDYQCLKSIFLPIGDARLL